MQNQSKPFFHANSNLNLLRLGTWHEFPRKVWRTWATTNKVCELEHNSRNPNKCFFLKILILSFASCTAACLCCNMDLVVHYCHPIGCPTSQANACKWSGPFLGHVHKLSYIHCNHLHQPITFTNLNISCIWGVIACTYTYLYDNVWDLHFLTNNVICYSKLHNVVHFWLKIYISKKLSIWAFMSK